MPTVDVRLVDVVKRYGEAVVVDHINLEVQTGEFFTLLGPSGCGKTTTLRMIGGFEQPTSGLIELKGEDVTWLPPYKRHVNTVFQNYALFPHLTIYENVAFGLRRTKVSDSEIRTRVTDMLQPGRAARLRAPQADPAVGRPGAARGARPGAHQSTLRPAPRRAARRARPEAAQADAGRAQADPAGGRDHVHLRDPRPGRSDDDVRSHRGHEPRQVRAAGRPGQPVRAARGRGSSPASSGSATCCRRPPRAPMATSPVSKLADGTPVRVPAALTEGLDALRDRRPPGEDPAARARPIPSRTASTSCSAPSATCRTSASRRATSSRRAAAAR